MYKTKSPFSDIQSNLLLKIVYIFFKFNVSLCTVKGQTTHAQNLLKCQKMTEMQTECGLCNFKSEVIVGDVESGAMGV